MMGGNGSWIIIVIYVAIFAGIYFLLIRPNSKKKKQEQKMRDSIQIGDDITTIGGIMGKIVSVKDESDSFVLETGADRVRMQFKKWAISTVDTEKETISVNGKKEKE
ncbi:MAG TPA: preprotein translocase subunit YajC [Clostridiales bacterium]|nr:preprotein translocase subunit YajC [Clostridiales bacterium]